MIDGITFTNLNAIVYHLKQGDDNGGIGREALANFLDGLRKDLTPVFDTHLLVKDIQWLEQNWSELTLVEQHDIKACVRNIHTMVTLKEE